MTSLRIALLLTAVVFAVACDKGEARPRCPVCGMFADVEGFAVTERGGHRFDSPKCAFQYREGTPGAQFQFTEYYSGELTDEADLRFVSDSDVIGPMGRDRIPVAPEQVERFVQDHGGQVVQRP